VTDLLQQLSQFLNLKSLVTVTVPGLLLTLALVIYFNPPKCQSDPEKCWYCQGQQTDSKETDKSADTDPTVRNKGSYFASTLTWSTANELYRHLGTEIPACDGIPKYLVTGTYLTANKETSQNLGDLQVADARTLLQNLDACSVGLNQALKNLKAKDKAIQPTINTLTTSVNALATKLESAEEASNGVLAASLRTNLDRDKKYLENATEEDQHVLADISRIDPGTTGSLLNQISAMQTTINGNVSQPVPVEKKPDPPTWQVVATQIASNIWLFLVVSIFVGQILDPIQRSLVSAEPLRGFLFPFLNFLYSRAVPWGSLRAGDRHYPTLNPSDERDKDGSLDFYEPNHAIGSGLITETEYVTLRDRFYSESQMTTGLILPILALAAVGLIRAACCGGIPAWKLISVGVVDLFGFAGLVTAAWQFLNPFGKGTGERFGHWRNRLFTVNAGKQISSLVWRVVIALLIFALLGFIAGKLLTSSLVGLIAGSVPPAIFALYIFGMDRLHNFYSELQSRIVGSFVKQSESQISKFVEIVTIEKSRDKLIKRLQETKKQSTDLLDELMSPKKTSHTKASNDELLKWLEEAQKQEREILKALSAFEDRQPEPEPLESAPKETLIKKLEEIQRQISEIAAELRLRASHSVPPKQEPTS